MLERVCVIQTKSVLTNLQVDVEWRTADSRAVDVDRRARWRTCNMGANAVRLGLRLGGSIVQDNAARSDAAPPASSHPTSAAMPIPATADAVPASWAGRLRLQGGRAAITAARFAPTCGMEKGPELLHEAERVEIRPVLDQLTALDTVNGYP